VIYALGLVPYSDLYLVVKRRSLLEAISRYDHRLSLSNAYEKRHKNTGLWIFETLEYKEWNEGLKSSGLWCYGIRKPP
jgi:hypothetical protein